MASRFVVVLALATLANASPYIINGVRDQRAYSIGQAYNYGGGLSTAQANVNGDNAQAYGSVGGNQLSRDGLMYPGLAVAQAQTNPDLNGAKAIAQAQNGGYYTVPAPATVITYHQNFETPAEVIYEVPSVQAHSSAVSNGGVESSIVSATSDGSGVAESSANTHGYGYEQTSSNAKTYGGYGSANSKANAGYGSASTSTLTQGQGQASSNAAINGVPAYPVSVVPTNEEVISVIDAKTPVFQTAYVPRVPVVPVAPVASSNANVIGSGSAASSAKVNGGLSGGRTISWRFGTLYDKPATYAQANTNSGFGGSTNANANVNSGAYNVYRSPANTHGYAHSDATANGAGAANANADVNSGYGAAKSTANTHYGQAASSANTNSGYGGAAKSNANINGGHYGGRTSVNAETHGYGNAHSSAKTHGVSTAYKVVNSQANSYGQGSARANAVTA